jgi:UDPglucose 6-dehydrogenase
LLVVTEWREFRSPDFAELKLRMRRPLVLDGRNLYDPADMRALGMEHVGIGRAESAPQATHVPIPLRPLPSSPSLAVAA